MTNLPCGLQLCKLAEKKKKNRRHGLLPAVPELNRTFRGQKLFTHREGGGRACSSRTACRLDPSRTWSDAALHNPQTFIYSTLLQLKET